MSVNNKSEASHYRRSGRSGNPASARNFSGGGRGGGGGGGTAPPSSAYYSGKSYKKVVSNAQGAPSRVPNPNGAHIEPPLRGTPDGSSTGAAVKPTDASVQKSSPGLPKAPQSNAVPLGSGAIGPSTPVKGPADASRGFPLLQFGSISPGVINGMQVPARTSSAPPNLDEQKRAQAHLDSLKTTSFQNQAVPKQRIPRKDPGPVDQPSEVRPVSKDKKDVLSSPPGPVAAHAQKPTGPPIPSISPGVSMQMPFHQRQIHLPFGGSNPSLQSQNMPNTSLPVPLPMPPPHIPMMYKAERKYEVGKVTDEEQAKQRKLKSILNKLTPQNFDKLFDQVKQVNIDNADTLSGVVGQIFDKALMEPAFVEMYANICSCLAVELPGFGDDNEKITFKRLLLNKCQEEFERGEREEKEEANRSEGEIKQTEEEREEKRVQARRRMLGNIRLIGELHKKRMLTERIMHECIKKLLGFKQKNPNLDEEDIEALCKLMSTTGEMIDHPKAKEHMDVYFDMMFQLSNNMTLSSRVRFMLKDAIDVRKNKWQRSTGYQKGLMPSPHTPMMHKAERKYEWEDHRPKSGIWKGSNGGEVISISGCDDDQTSADTSALSKITSMGAMTYCFIEAIEHGNASTYGSLLSSMRNAIRNSPRGFSSGGGGWNGRRGLTQAHLDSLKTTSFQNQAVPKQRIPRKDPGPVDQPSEVRPVSKDKKDVLSSPPGPVAAHAQKPTGPPIPSISPGVSMQMPFHQRQIHLPFGGSNPSLQSQNMPNTSLPVPLPMPPPHIPMMHKAERKYEVGKVTDEEQAKQRKLKSILNKLTPQNFDKLFDQVKQVNIDNADTLSGVVGQIFDKALMEPAFVEMYANICSCLAVELPGFGDDNEKITFKRLLLNKCQEEFERGEREEKEEANRSEGEIKQTEEEREEKRVQARRRMLGNIRLIGELHKKRMLTEGIMHECLKKLLGFKQKNPNPDEEDIEALCKLMSTTGEMIDHPKAKEHMDVYFDMMFQLSNNMTLSSRVRFMLKDAIDVRKNKWQRSTGYQKGLMPSPHTPMMHKAERKYEWEDHRPKSGIWKGSNGGEVISISGCDDDQTSADTSALSKITSTGAMTYCFIEAIEHGNASTYGSLLSSMRNAICHSPRGFSSGGGGWNGRRGFTQEPQLTSCEPFDMFTKPFSL